MTNRQAFNDISDLLVRAGVVSSQDMIEAVQVSRRLKMPITRVLTTSGYLGEDLLYLLANLEPLINDRLVTADIAVNSLRRLMREAINPELILDEIYSLPRFGENTKQLLDLLQDSEVISSQELEQAVEETVRTGSSLSSVLVLKGILSADLFSAIVRIQEQLKSKKISFSKAIEDIKREYSFWLKANESQSGAFQRIEEEDRSKHKKALGKRKIPRIISSRFRERDSESQEIKLGELLILAQLVQPDQLSLDISGEMLKEAKLFDPQTLALVRETYQLLVEGHITIDNATKILRTQKMKCVPDSDIQKESEPLFLGMDWKKGIVSCFTLGCLVCAATSYLLNRKMNRARIGDINENTQ